MKIWLKEYGSVLFFAAACGVAGLFLIKNPILSGDDGNSIVGFEELKDQVTKALSKVETIQRSVARNGDRFHCLRLGGGEACRDKGGQFVLYSSEKRDAGSLSQLSSFRGLNRNKQTCDGFPSPQCPYRIETTWKAVNTSNLECDAVHPIRVVARIVLNSGSIYHEWKKEVVSSVRVPLEARARCQCENKDGFVGNCGGANAEATAQANVEVAKDPREAQEAATRELASKPSDGPIECSPQIEFRGEQYAVLSVDAQGQAELELAGEDTRCNTIDAYRFQCVGRQGANGQVLGEWVFTGVRRGSCSEPVTTNTTDLVSPPPTDFKVVDEAVREGDSTKEPAQTNESESILEDPIDAAEAARRAEEGNR